MWINSSNIDGRIFRLKLSELVLVRGVTDNDLRSVGVFDISKQTHFMQ